MKFQSIPVRLVSNQDYPSKAKVDEFGHAFTNADGTVQQTVHFRVVEFEEIDDLCITPDTLRLKLFADQADRFNFSVGTEGYLLIVLENHTTKEGKEYVDIKIKNFQTLPLPLPSREGSIM